MTVHGVVVGEVLPVKTSKTKSGINCKYFDGTCTDGKMADLATLSLAVFRLSS